MGIIFNFVCEVNYLFSDLCFYVVVILESQLKVNKPLL